MTRRHTGKRIHRKKRFAPPKVPDAEQLESHQSYGVITKYHGGHDRAMDVTIYNTETKRLDEIRCRLKGSLRHAKCKQKIALGSYCLVSYGDEVAIIFTTGQIMSIPETIHEALSKVCQFSYVGAGTDSAVHFARADDDYMPESDSEYEYESDDSDDSDGIVFEAVPSQPIPAKPLTSSGFDIDAI